MTESNGPTMKGWVGLVSMGIAGVALVATLHAAFVVPAILFQVDTRIDARLDRHNNRPHPGAAGMDDIKLLRDQLNRIEEKLNAR